jgi:hypothetical protein
MYIKKTFFYLMILFGLVSMAGCASRVQPTNTPVQHADPFYNINHNDYPLLHLPLIKPIRADREDGRTSWRVLSPNGPWVHLPNRQDNSYYVYAIEELEKFAVKNDVIMAYSAYVDKNADPYIQDNYYHWFVLITDKKIAEGFHTEVEFTQYIQTLGIQSPDWTMPDDAYDTYKKTGCLDWLPDCK